jgi:uncharacterized protein (TIGR03382 family)
MRYTHIISLAALGAAPLAASAEMPPWSDYQSEIICRVSNRQYSIDGPQLQSSRLVDISGLAASRWQTNVLWVHNSAGDAPNLYAVNAWTGALSGTWIVRDASAIDWEDLAQGLCDHGDASKGSCLFIADIGDDALERTDQMIYRVREPDTRGVMPGEELMTERADAFPVVYELPAGEPNPDAESLAVHPVTGKLYIVTKEQGKGRVLESDPPGAPGAPLTFRVIGEVDLPTPTAMDINPTGSLLIVKGPREVREYHILNNDVRAAVQSAGRQLAVAPELQGGAISYTNFIPNIQADKVLTYGGDIQYDLYTISDKQIRRYSHECDLERQPVSMRPEPHDMGTNERPDMSTPPSDLGVEDMNDASEMSWGMDMNDAPEMSWGVDMGAADMSDASEDGPGEGCSSAGASAPAALLWLLAPLAARVRRRKGGDV